MLLLSSVIIIYDAMFCKEHIYVVYGTIELRYMFSIVERYMI